VSTLLYSTDDKLYGIQCCGDFSGALFFRREKPDDWDYAAKYDIDGENSSQLRQLIVECYAAVTNSCLHTNNILSGELFARLLAEQVKPDNALFEKLEPCAHKALENAQIPLAKTFELIRRVAEAAYCDVLTQAVEDVLGQDDSSSSILWIPLSTETFEKYLR